MVYIYQADSDWFRERFEVKDLLRQLPESLHEKALRYKFDKDAFNFILGRLMLKKGLSELGLVTDLEKIIFNKNGKPVLNGVFFNISHSGNLVVCALTQKGDIGIDVEQERKIDLPDFRSVFTDDEWKKISEDDFPLKNFYWYWTRKESIIKALGIDISYLNQIEIDATQNFFLEGKKKWYLKDLDFGAKNFGAICSENEIREIKMYVFEKHFWKT